jgi:osmotically-inducible protein OsmY
MHCDQRTEDTVAHPNQSGGRDVALPEENQPSWRPQDDEPVVRGHGDDNGDYRGWQDRGYRDDRHGDRRGDALRSYRDERRPSAGSFEDRNYDLGVDDRFIRRSGYWEDRPGYDRDRQAPHGSYRGRDFEPERRGLSRSGLYGRYDERLGYPAGSYRQGNAGAAGEVARRDLGAEPHVHRGTGPHRGKGPAGYQRSDERIRELVCDSLTDDDQLDASHIEVSVSHGEVTLSGTVDDRRAKRDAEDCAWSAPGVRDVHNLLRIATDATRGNLSAQPAVGKPEIEPAQDKKHRG